MLKNRMRETFHGKYSNYGDEEQRFRRHGRSITGRGAEREGVGNRAQK